MSFSWTRRREYVFYAFLCLLAFSQTAILMPESAGDFRRFFGTVHPFVVVALTGAFGGLSLAKLEPYGWNGVLRGRSSLSGIGLAFGIATVFAVAVVVADILIRYPKDLNVAAPEAWLFYPAVGLVAEIVFHVIPLTLLTLVLEQIGVEFRPDRIPWLAIVLAAAVEPSFQIAFEPELLSWSAGFTWGHVFLFGLAQLHMFRRYDFVTMYCFRIFYYAYWHIIWGGIRLDVLY